MKKLKPVDRKHFWASKVKRGKIGVSMRAAWFADRFNNSIRNSDVEASLDLWVEFAKEFKKCWDNRDDSFFVDLGRAVKFHYYESFDISRHEKKYDSEIQKILFRDKLNPDRQTHYFSDEDLCRKIDKLAPDVVNVTTIARARKRLGAISKQQYLHPQHTK